MKSNGQITYQVQHIPTGALLASTESDNFKNKKQLEQFAKIVSADKEFNNLIPRNAVDLRLKQLLQMVRNNA